MNVYPVAEALKQQISLLDYLIGQVLGLDFALTGGKYDVSYVDRYFNY